ncbi:cupin domain-containing protein [Thermodesulfovibrio thiophilus]|uniref:cupin domain-containing protein n=1 Tax=Thermodesulfovibrio thiophilus TaxID=340095 RepID=UPI00041717FE|nr:cupin domain-containing protein [Thermodesulfovibrio thiophilus]
MRTGIKIGEIIEEKNVLSQLLENFKKVKIYKVISDKNFDIYLISVQSNYALEKYFLPEEKSAFIYILKGTVSLFIDNDSYNLKEGGSLYLNKAVPANWVNEGGEKLEILSVTM